jgi:hypothetical protein
MIVTPLPLHPPDLVKRADMRASYDTLRHFLGAQTSPWDNEKTHVEWVVDTPLGPLNVYDYGDLHICRITPPRKGERYPRGCRRNPAHHVNHCNFWTWSAQAVDDDVVAWLDSLPGVYITRCKVWGAAA